MPVTNFFTTSVPDKVLKLLLSACVFLSPCTQAQWFADVSSEVLLNDNLSRSSHDGVEASGLAAAVAAGYYWQTTDYTGITLHGSLQQNFWHSYSGMNSLDATLNLALRHKFGIGESKPVLSFNLGYQRRSFSNSLRDAAVFSADARLSKRVSNNLQLSLSASHERSDGDQYQAIPPAGFVWPPKSGKVWDYSAWTLSVQAELDLGPVSWLSGGFSYRNGPVVSTGIVYTQPNVAAIASTYDPVFGPHAVAYQIDARTRILTFDYNRALFETSTWYLGTEYQSSTASSGVNYDSSILRTGFIHSF